MSIDTVSIIDIVDKDWTPLIDCIDHLRTNKRLMATPQHEHPPLHGVLELLNSLQCEQVLVCFPFHDEDFAYDYLSHLGRSFHDCGKHCARLHFFTGGVKFTADNLIDLLISVGQKIPTLATDTTTVSRTPNPIGNPRYLGYMVIRPTEDDCIGRTIISEPPAKRGRSMIHVKARYAVSCCGVELSVTGSPFLMQDRSSHVCAGAALWSMCYDLHRRYKTPRLFPRQITEIANEFYPRREFEGGHTPNEVSQVLRKLGCGNDVVSVDLEFQNADTRRNLLRDLLDVIYGYVESNIPVLVGYWLFDVSKGNSDDGSLDQVEPGHLVLVVGHDYNPELTISKKATGRRVFSEIIPEFSSRFVENLIVCDDQLGPYQHLRIWKAPPSKSSSQDNLALENAKHLVVIPGVANNVYMTYRDARVQVERQLIELEGRYHKHIADGGFAQLPAEYYRRMLDLLEDQSNLLRLRLYLQLSRRFRKLLLDPLRGRVGIGPKLRDIYCQMNLPKYLWVCDICARVPFANGRYELLGELLFDATAPRFAHDESLIALRIVGDLQYRVDRQWKRKISQTCFAMPPEERLAPINAEDYSAT